MIINEMMEMRIKVGIIMSTRLTIKKNIRIPPDANLLPYLKGK